MFCFGEIHFPLFAERIHFCFKVFSSKVLSLYICFYHPLSAVHLLLLFFLC